MHDHTEMDLMLRGYGLTTAKILYHFPDHPHLLQSYIWQDYDIAPKFPVLIRFIEFWKAKLDGPLHSVTYTHQTLVAPNEWRKVDGEFLVH
ncbi:MAG: aspartate-semialdehyde dehydrogenase [Mesorhizobium sp.]|uniref:usg protein n=1 Tax=unclassified Mesorhizobium TaxID=325217 RepID=UPI000F75F1B6|nr:MULTISPECIES: aspartate-semialdehyde dehydrogenase [unclassified Mesorhizobium]RVD73390.1 aspartate-semialdehyde dehydrogenase [Mesorhizobium sp. M4A.F.Ca.ET.029.04.2.1]AZO50140.1 aspartate-semialdehyde dehydrogenase [Mesorhizobium sp. M4B.F.Ca.ET.058.02.1.1]RUX51168.1 aspartate-semialdehyde dehydrogenase [Mesorhizobium sp. M4A.F.Ca.ET.050.02.1.1]RVC42876.1 aspartate-semialdehyde dehydrogenase [Mesorhizobium sp. M4A.F.Ca.ET.090.04.2.1]RVC83116.1 aspartate-semialdehyde dehydrogenase [Mesorhi